MKAWQVGGAVRNRGVVQNGGVLQVTEWANEILNKSQEAARRLNPNAKIRLASAAGGVEARLTDEPAPNDQAIPVGEMTLYVQAGLEGLIDVEEPHDRLVLRPAGSSPNARGH
jgi:hypothetical protein